MQIIQQYQLQGDKTYVDRISIIALHGLGGKWDETWTSESLDGCWLLTLAWRFPTSRILSVDHPSIFQDLASIRVDVTGLITDLIHERSLYERSDHPIIFVGHSFGGSFLKKIYISTHPLWTQETEHHRLHRSVRAFVYFGTPHGHLSFPNISALWRTFLSDNDSMLPGNSLDLSYAMTNISRINDDFRDFNGEKLSSLCFYETVKTRVGLDEVTQSFPSLVYTPKIRCSNSDLVQRYIVSKLDATITSRPVEVIPLDLRHQALGKIGSASDNNLSRLIPAFDRLIVTVKRSDPTNIGLTETRANRRGLNLLSLDGGGVKGYFTILVLQRLLEAVARLEKMGGEAPSAKRPCDYFHLIGGTSTGGLLAIMLGRLQMDIKACICTYKTLSRTVFNRFNKVALVQHVLTVVDVLSAKSWYSGDSLKAAVCNTIKENVGPLEREFNAEDLRLFSTIASDTGRCFVCAVPNGQHTAERLRSYRSINDGARDTSAYTIWEAARATSAAPMYFSSINIQGQVYFDGGLHCNNPVVEVIKEARTEFPSSYIRTVVSIGTGSAKITEPNWFPNIISNFVERVTDTEARHQDVLNDDSFKDVRAGYFRFQEQTKLGEIDLAAADKLDEIEKLAKQFLNSEKGKRLIENCAERLAAK